MQVNMKQPGWGSGSRDESSFAPRSTYDNWYTEMYLVLSFKGIDSQSVQEAALREAQKQEFS